MYLLQERAVARIDSGRSAAKAPIDASRIPTGAGAMMDLHPDGQQLAYHTGANRTEVWVLENFLPVLKESK